MNRNPRASILSTIFISNLVNSSLKLPSTKNCKEDGDKFVKTSTTKESFIQTPPTESDGYETQVTEPVLDVVTNLTVQPLQNKPEATLEDYAVSYFAGYLAKVCLDNFKCHTFQKALKILKIKYNF